MRRFLVELSHIRRSPNVGWSVHSWDVLMLPTLSFPVPLHGRCSWNVLELKSIRVLQLLLQNISQKQPKLARGLCDAHQHLILGVGMLICEEARNRDIQEGEYGTKEAPQ